MDILLPIATYPDVTDEAALDRALVLSARLDARITALIQQVDVPPVHSGLGEILLDLSSMVAQAEQRSHHHAEAMHRWVLERGASLGLVGVSAGTVVCNPLGFADHLLPVARHHDLALVVLDGSDPQRVAEMEALVFDSGGPVLVLPARPTAVPLPDGPATPLRVTLSWDGSRAASRALRDALPILARAGSVMLVTIGDDKTIDPAGIAGVLAFLQHHGIAARHLPRSRGSAAIGETLQAVAISQDADLLVMGAYGHNRLQQLILGGATRAILRAPRLPILLSH